MTSAAPAHPLVWMNVTTSANWDRAAVGIVRVEQALSRELAELYGDRFRRCVWVDNAFVEWSGVEHSTNPVEDTVDVLLPPVPTFHLARRVLASRLARVLKGSHGKAGKENQTALIPGFPVDAEQPISPRAGDVLISVGLDWDQPYHTELYRLSKLNGLRVITCCYDLIPILFPQYCVGAVAPRFKGYFDLVNWSSAAVLCISKQSEKDLLELWDASGSHRRLTKVIPLGDNVPMAVGSISDEIQTLTAEPFILFVSTIERRKNHEVLYKAYHILCRAGHKGKLPKLVFVGMHGWGVGDLLKDIELDPFTQGLIVQLNHVSDAELLELYRRALFCVYPSLYEGWGLPVGEALSLGKVVLSSDRGSLPEVGGDLVRYLSPWDAEAWADAILELSSDDVKLERLAKKVRRGYSTRTWRDTAKAVAEVIDSLVDAQSREFNLYPGYDFSTQCGIHVGHKIRAVGRAGVLMHGPYVSMSPGYYDVRIRLHRGVEPRSRLTFDVVSDDGTVCHAKRVLESSEDWSGGEICLHISLKLETFIEDLEIRCFVDQPDWFDIDAVEIQ